MVQSVQVLAYIVISLHILAILRRTIGDAFGSGELAVHHDCLGILIIGDGFGLSFQSRSPGVESRIGGCPSSSFVVNIGLQLFIRIFQIGNRIFAFTCFFFNGISIGFDLRIEGI